MSVLKIKTSENTWEKVNSIPSIPIDTTLTQSGVAADSKTVGDRLAGKQPIGDYAIKSELGALANKNNVSKSDLDTELQETLDKIGELPSDFTETDPTVPAWAKEQNKPSYTATEVGADPTGTAIETVSSHNSDPEAHEEIRNLIGEKVYSQNDEPVDAEDGSVWIDLDEEGSSGGACVFVQDDEPANADTGTLWLDTDEESASGTVTSIPTFNLTEMGLPLVPTDGTSVSVDVDCTELREALLAGPIKAMFNVSFNGYSVPFTGVFCGLYLSAEDCWQMSAIATITRDGAPLIQVGTFNVRSNNIVVSMHALQTGTDGSGAAAEIPTFDLAAMGLPTIPLDGTVVTVKNIDCTALRNALAAGMIKAVVNISMLGQTVQSTVQAYGQYDSRTEMYTMFQTFAIWNYNENTIYHATVAVADDYIDAFISVLQQESGDTGNSGSSDILIVTASSGTASHTADEIMEAADAGKIVLLTAGGIPLVLSETSSGGYVKFSVISNVDSYGLVQQTVRIDNDKSISVEMDEIIPAYTSDDIGKSLTVTSSGLAWVAQSGSTADLPIGEEATF